MKLILGSSSKWRRQVMQDAGFSCELMSPDIDEKAIRHENPEVLVRMITQAKNKALQEKIQEDALIITADQVVDFQGSIREKPEHQEEAEAFLRSYSGSSVDTVSGVGVYNTKNKRFVFGVDRVTIIFDSIPEEVIKKLAQDQHITSIAGGFSIEHPLLAPYIKEIRGTKDSVWGLPIHLLKRLLEEVQIDELSTLYELDDSTYDTHHFYHRKAARIVAFDEEGKIPLLYVEKYDFYKLPGGGLEGSEDMKEALHREVLEEVGAACTITTALGMIREYRAQYQMTQDSYCFTGRITKKGEPLFTQKEQEEGFKLCWCTPGEALEKMSRLPQQYQGQFIVRRDRIFLEKALESFCSFI